MQGFKSFADKTELEFDKGITAIVGPNGSGKSNVSDAIRWVMGEQSAKSLRGSRMEDVIFSGTQNRNPLGFAEVSIILDNSDKSLPLEFSEAVVTRRVHRSGESEYFINKIPCRLKDIHELFMDTGIGREGYSVVGQGKIDEILSSKSEDRRHIFEEAAGISKYKYRKNEAEKKLLNTEENLVRIRDILSELSGQVGPLENQSKKARKYLDLREVLKGLEINIAIRSIEKYKEDTKKCEDDLKVALNQLNDAKKQKEELEALIEKTQSETVALNRQISRLKEEQFGIEKSHADLINKITLYKNDIENNEGNCERIIKEIEELDKKALKIEEEGKSLASGLEEKDKELLQMEEKLSEYEKELEQKREDSKLAYSQIESKKAEIVDILNKIAANKANIEGFDVVFKNFHDRKSAVKDESDTKKKELAQLEEAIEGLTKKLSEDNKYKETLSLEMEKIKKDYFRIMEENESLKNKQNEITLDYNNKFSRMKALEDLEKSLEGYARSVKEILNSRLSGVVGVVSKLIEVKSEYAVAIETAMGRSLQDIVVKTPEDAKGCIEYLKKNRLGRATFLPVSSVKENSLKHPPKEDNGYIGIASDLITYDKEYADIISSLVGKTVIVDNIDNAIKIAKKNDYGFKIVTLDGQVVNTGGSLTGGSIDKRSGLISRTKEIEELKTVISKLEKEIDKNDEKLFENKKEIEKIASKKEEIERNTASLDTKIASENTELSHIKLNADNVKKTIENLTKEDGSILTEIDDISHRKDELTKEIAAFEESVTAIRKTLSEEEGQYEIQLTKVKEAEDSFADRRVELGNASKDREVIELRMAALVTELNDAKESVIRKKSEIESIKKENIRIAEEIEKISSGMNNAKTNFSELTEKISEMEDAYNKSIESTKEVQNKAKEKQDEVFVLGQEVTRCENKVAKITSDTETVINKLWDDYEVTPGEAENYRTPIESMQSAIREAASIKREIKELGNINLDSIEEYKVVKERHEFLSNQESDLSQAKSDLLKVIDEMQTIMKERFSETFEKIKVSFNETFSELFGGGVAKLSFADESNILESGIEIEVQPPGKKLQNLTLLSGGERAFSAIALLFAVIKITPTPFCLLDEVEAALDEVNVYKFADYARRYSENTQFLIVTHRRGTMENADIMYGVTMQEKGVSKILKLKFEDLEDYDV